MFGSILSVGFAGSPWNLRTVSCFDVAAVSGEAWRGAGLTWLRCLAKLGAIRKSLRGAKVHFRQLRKTTWQRCLAKRGALRSECGGVVILAYHSKLCEALRPRKTGPEVNGVNPVTVSPRRPSRSLVEDLTRRQTAMFC